MIIFTDTWPCVLVSKFATQHPEARVRFALDDRQQYSQSDTLDSRPIS